MRLYSIILTLVLTGCNYNHKDVGRVDKVESYKLFFYNNREIFERLTHEILNNNKLTQKGGRYINLEDLSKQSITQLRRLAIEKVSLLAASCEQHDVEYLTSWTERPMGQLYLTKTKCQDSKSIKNNYWSDGNLSEVWGLGDGWKIRIDRDSI